MEFRIADTFTSSLARLAGDEQKAAKTTAFDLQMDPAGNGMRFHKLDKAKDPNFWSVRVNRDIRLIVHKTAGSLLLCYVDHHDKAYQWAERRRLETHPTTGAAQLVEIRELVREISVPRYVETAQPAPAALFDKYSDEQLLAYGVPLEWLVDVRAAAEDSLLKLVSHLPDEAAEALLELATGGMPVASKPADKTEDPFRHPDAQRRFRVMSDTDELARALEYPWDKWTVFLHPAQRQMVERNYNGPARVSGSAGTGKTVVALHRAVQLAGKDEDARILLSTFSDIGVQQLRFLASIAGDRSNALFFAGDLGQRIFQQPFSWKSLGVDVRGRSRTLNINYRTSHQIRSQADLLLGPEVSDVDGNIESRKGTISVFNGPEPVILSFDLPDLESQAVGQWLKQSSAGGVLPHEIGVFVRSEEEFPRALAAIAASGLKARVLGKEMATEDGFASLTTMHLAKGMEFRVVAVMACDDEIIPSQTRIDLASDEAELTEIYNTERQLLYVACTRARDMLHVSSVKPGSEFLQDLTKK